MVCGGGVVTPKKKVAFGLEERGGERKVSEPMRVAERVGGGVVARQLSKTLFESGTRRRKAVEGARKLGRRVLPSEVGVLEVPSPFLPAPFPSFSVAFLVGGRLLGRFSAVPSVTFC